MTMTPTPNRFYPESPSTGWGDSESCYMDSDIESGVPSKKTRAEIDKTYFLGLPDPETVYAVAARPLSRLISVVHILLSIMYLLWRWVETLRRPDSAPDAVYIIGFLMAEHGAVLGFCIDHFKTWNQVRRPILSISTMSPYMVDSQAPRVALLITTAGEPLQIVSSCLRGAITQFYPCSRLQITVLDDKNRPEILLLVKQLVRWRQTRTSTEFIEFLESDLAVMDETGGDHEEAMHLNDWLELNDKINSDEVEVFEEFPNNDLCPTVIYLARDNTPGADGAGHMKAGNLNAGIWWHYERSETWEPDMVFINDCRHELAEHCMDRMTGYMYKKNEDGFTLNDEIAFVQIPQRFDEEILGEDLMGNHAPGAYDKNNVGQDGVGAVMSSGHGFLVRWDALLGRWAGTEAQYTVDVDDKGALLTSPARMRLERSQIGSNIAGFPTYSLIEDTELSMSLFMRGWSSVYVLVPIKDIANRLSVCVYPPATIYARKKQLYRWYLGANQLFDRVLKLMRCSTFKSPWHKLVVVDAVTYPLQSIPAAIIMITPIVFCVTWKTPFDTDIFTYMLWFIPLILLHYSSVWMKTWLATGVPMLRMWNEECVWLACCHLHFYALSGQIQLGNWVSTGAGGAKEVTSASDKMEFNSTLALYPTRLLYRLYIFALWLSVCNWWVHDWQDSLTMCATFMTVFVFMWRIKKIAHMEKSKGLCDSKWHTMMGVCLLGITVLAIYKAT
jgi:cellulose synthase/poly-beta-1,6-N-acetylglucosamine synthase-like glycosyltransferase